MANIAKDVKSRPAGINDNFEIAVMDINNVVENNKFVLKANGGMKIPDLSTELTMNDEFEYYINPIKNVINVLSNTKILKVMDEINKGNDTLDKLILLGYDEELVKQVLEKK